MPCHRVSEGPLKTVTREEPCDYRDNNLERYYPVKTGDGRYDHAYDSYRMLAERVANVTFIAVAEPINISTCTKSSPAIAVRAHEC
jgi:UDP-galactopyranose mutase